MNIGGIAEKASAGISTKGGFGVLDDTPSSRQTRSRPGPEPGDFPK